MLIRFEEYNMTVRRSPERTTVSRLILSKESFV